MSTEQLYWGERPTKEQMGQFGISAQHTMLEVTEAADSTRLRVLGTYGQNLVPISDCTIPAAAWATHKALVLDGRQPVRKGEYAPPAPAQDK